MWCAWFIGNLPGFRLAPGPMGAALLATLVAASVLAGTAMGRRTGWRVGAGAGFLASVLNLLILGSQISQPPEAGEVAPGFEGLSPAAIAVIPAFLAFGTVIGIVGGFLGSRLVRRVEPPDSEWLPRFAVVTAVAIAPLLVVGGVVTSTASGLAVRDWPGTFGSNMFLYPISQLTRPRVFFEHSHRLFGSLVGLTALAQMVWAWRCSAVRPTRGWIAGLFALICIQGILGGWRVVAKNPYAGLAHGVLAQLVFALAIAVAAWLSPTYRFGSIEPNPADRRRKFLATGLLHSAIMQLLLGATFRHLRRVGFTGAMHTLWTHAAFSIIVVIFAVATGAALASRRGGPAEPTLRRIGRGLIGVVALQFILGWVAAAAVLSAGIHTPVPESHEIAQAPPVGVWEALAATGHQANGAALLGLAALALVWMRRLLRGRP